MDIIDLAYRINISLKMYVKIYLNLTIMFYLEKYEEKNYWCPVFVFLAVQCNVGIRNGKLTLLFSSESTL